MGDPWVVQPHELAKFTEHFERLGPTGGQLSGEQSKKFMLQSQLPPPVLGQIWSLADTNVDGKLDLREFSIACKIINLKLHGMEVPKLVPQSLSTSISHVGVPKPLSPPQAQQITPISSPPTMTPAASIAPLIPSAPVPHIPPPVSNIQPLISNVPSMVSNVSAATAPLVPLIPSSTVSGVPLIPNIPLATTAPLMSSAPLISSAPLVQTGSLISTAAPPLISDMDLVLSMQSAPPASVPPASIGSMPLSASQQLLASQMSPPLSGPVTSTPIQQPHLDLSSPTGAIDPSGIISPTQLSPEWSIPQPQRLKYTQLFNATDRSKTGAVNGPQARGIMLQSKLPQATLAKIWALADLDVDGKLGCDEFVLAMYLCEMATRGEVIPAKLPPELVPPIFRRDSTGSGGPSFEDKRRENFARGQAELDRRRAVLAESHVKEKEAEVERERKEREEIEKREKLRADQLMKEQEEFLRRQRDEQEKRDAARKEMERQCQLEWENKRFREAEAKRTALSAEVAALRGGASRRTGAANAARQRAAGLARDIRDTRSKVAELKGIIDGMRSTRDVSLQESTQLKARIKELNAKQISLNQEKAHLDSKARTESSTEDGTFSNMEIVLKQLREKIETAQQVVEGKKVDVDSNNSQLRELNDTVVKLKEKCEVIWASYEEKKKLYEEKRAAAAAVDMSSAWDTDPAASAWGDSGGWNDTSSSAVEEAPIAATVTATSAAVPVSASASSGVVSRFRCIFEFVARSNDELSLQPGDVVTSGAAPAAGEPGWKWGECRGAQGWYPEAYVEEVQSSGLEVSPFQAEPEAAVEMKTHLEGIAEVPENVSEPGAQASLEGGEAYTAAYPYTSAEPGDLNFQAGEVIMVTQSSGDWWAGYVADTNRSGIFPSNYVQKHAETKAEPNEPVNALPEKSPFSIEPKRQENIFIYPEDVAERPPPEEQKATTPVSTEVASITEAAAAVIRAADGQNEAASIGSRRDSGRDSSLGGKSKKEVAQAIAAYTANGPEQLTIQKGQLILVRKKADSGWWEGELQAKGRSRQIGWFPASYVKVLQSSGRASGRTTPVLSGKMEGADNQVIDKVMALYPYTAQNADELSFDKDDIISVTNRDQDPAWWQGELRGMIGLFPSNYVTKLTHDG